MKSNPAYVNATYAGSFVWRDTGDWIQPYITICLTKGVKKVLNPVWVNAKIPSEMRATKQLSLAWLRLVLDDGLNESDLPNWWPKENNLYFHENETQPKR